MKDLTTVLKALYVSEINVSISCLWDGGWDIALGDEINGWHTKTMVENLDYAPAWLIENAVRLWPNSDFAKFLSALDKL